MEEVSIFALVFYVFVKMFERVLRRTRRKRKPDILFCLFAIFLHEPSTLAWINTLLSLCWLAPSDVWWTSVSQRVTSKSHYTASALAAHPAVWFTSTYGSGLNLIWKKSDMFECSHHLEIIWPGHLKVRFGPFCLQREHSLTLNTDWGQSYVSTQIWFCRIQDFQTDFIKSEQQKWCDQL